MKITHINIRRYFALRDISFSPSSFTLVFGANDTGKTMLLDAILDTLFGVRGRRERRFFPGFNRYDLQDPQDVVITVQWRHGTVKIDGTDPLDTLSGLGEVESFMTLRNLLVVRESEIRFGPDNEERRWWSFVRRRLSGLKGGVERVIAEVARASGVSARGRWLSKIKKEEVEALQRRLFSLSAAAEEVATLEAISRELNRLGEERKKIEQELNRVERLKKKSLYHRLRSELAAYRKLREELAALEGIDESLLLRWQELQGAITRHQEALKGLQEKIGQTLAEVRAKEEEAAELMRKSAEWEKLEVSLLPGVEKLLGTVKRLYRSRRRHEWVRGAGRVVIVAGLGLLVVGGVLLGMGVSVAGGLLMLLLGGMVFSVGVGAGISLAKIARRMAQKKEEILSLVSKAGIVVQDTEDVERWMEAGRRDATESKARAELLLVEARGGRAKVEELTGKASRIEEELRAAAKRAEALKAEARVATIADLRAQFERKRTLETELTAHIKTISQITAHTNEEDWFKKLAELEPFSNEEGEYDSQDEETLRQRLAAIDEIERELLGKKEAVERRLASVGVKTPAEMLVEAQTLRAKLDRIEAERGNALLAMELLGRLRRKQSTALGFVLQHTSEATPLFRSMTADRYTRLIYRDGLLFAESIKGETYPVDHLSSGARTLAFFALRLALLKKILPTPAFLLLDDPFIFCDSHRLRLVLKVLTDLMTEGWQIIYFTHDERVLSWLSQQTTSDFSVVRLSSDESG